MNDTSLSHTFSTFFTVLNFTEKTSNLKMLPLGIAYGTVYFYFTD